MRDPELPEAARPQWPPWYAPAALFASFGAIVVAGFPLLPVIFTFGISEAVAGVACSPCCWSRTGCSSSPPCCSRR